MPCDDCLSRREFLTRSTLAVAGAALVAGCGDGQIGPSVTGTNGPFAQSFKVALIPGLATTGQLVQIGSVDTQLIGVKRTGPSTFAAWSMFCTHEGCPTNIENNRFICHCHDSVFDNQGQVVRGPANRPLPAATAVYDAQSDTLTLTLAGGTRTDD
jgi:Rieske Fe-S protein